MKIAVVDDDEGDRKQLVSYIKSSCQQLNCEVEISAHSLGENFLEDEDLFALDAVFLDIYMGIKNGMEVAQALRSKGYVGIIVFCTTTAQFALEGYSVKAMNYIIKPFTYEKIAVQIKDIFELLGKEEVSIRIKDGRQWHKVKLTDILYIEKQGNYVHIQTSNKAYSVRTALGEMEEKLLGKTCFVKCDRGIIVNMENIEEINDNVIHLKNNNCVPVSRNHKTLISDKYFDFIFNKME